VDASKALTALKKASGRLPQYEFTACFVSIDVELSEINTSRGCNDTKSKFSSSDGFGQNIFHATSLFAQLRVNAGAMQRDGECNVIAKQFIIQNTISLHIASNTSDGRVG
jgi:hypothetical protein